MKLSIACYGDPILRKKASPVATIDDDLRRLVDDMIDTMIASNGVGLAATQVHIPLAVFIAFFFQEEDEEIDRERVRVFINPKVLSYSKETGFYSEGCLSIPKIYEDVERPLRVLIEAQDLSGNWFKEEYSDYNAHIVLHENDHLNGVLFIDRIPPKARNKLDPYLRKMKKQGNRV